MNIYDPALLDQLIQAIDLCNINNLSEAARWIAKHFWIVDGVPIATSNIMFFNTYRGVVECLASEPNSDGKYAGIIRPQEGSGYKIGAIVVTKHIHDTPDAAIQAAKKCLAKIRSIHPHSLTRGGNLDA